ncbi:MAG: VWA domain-containing protein [Acidobacteriota bacterium]|nr:VWA domain-containing protein [Acidobacteriota bacterium]MDH3524020.1 VWA domain-containing protein [Acidobacteriota bacterium]
MPVESPQDAAARAPSRTSSPRLAALLVAAGWLGWALAAAGSAAAAAEPQAGSGTGSGAGTPEEEAVLWPEHQRAFFQDGPALLLDAAVRRELAAMGEEERDRFLAAFLRDPLPATEVNELTLGIERRMQLAASEVPTPFDDRARLLFLRGAPESREEIDCGTTLVPVEIWSYGPDATEVLFYQPAGRRAYRLWRPHDGKRVLYSALMEGWFAELEDFGQERRRIDIQLCSAVARVDRVTRTAGLFDEQPDLELSRAIDGYLAPPADLAAWSAAAATTPAPAAAAPLAPVRVEVEFPFRTGQRVAARFVLTLDDAAGLGVREREDGGREVELEVDGLLELDGDVFEDFKVRFSQAAPAAGAPVVLVFDRRLRPGRRFLARLAVRDAVGGASARLVRPVAVPREVERVVEGGGLAVPAEEVAGVQLAGVDSLVLVPPVTDGLSGAWRAEALVTGERIAKVVFFVDGEQQLVRTRPPFTADLRLAEVPVEQTVTARGLDAEGEVVDEDSVLLNRARGLFAVRIVEPAGGVAAGGEARARAEIDVPDEARLEVVEFSVNDELVASLTSPPWEALIRLEAPGGVSFLTVEARLEDGRRAEDVVFLDAPDDLAYVEVGLVELFATVTDGSGRFAEDLTAADFQVLEAGEERSIERFDRVHNLPLVVGFALDASTSMADHMADARRAAIGFLESVLRPGDRAFAVAFSDKPRLVAPPSDDPSIVERALADVHSSGWTTLYDAVVRSLFYFRGFGGRRALVVLSDGEDTASRTSFAETLDYARRSGTVVYSIGLGKGAAGGKLQRLADETGGRYFQVGDAAELGAVYAAIERELRSQYFLTFVPAVVGEADLSAVEVRVRDRGLKVRATRGYAP